MKLSKRGWMITAIAVFVTAAAGLAVTNFQQFQRQKQLNGQLIQLQSDLRNAQVNRLIRDKTELEAHLKEVTQSFKNLTGMLTSQTESSAIAETMFGLASAHNLEVVNLTSTVPSKQNLAGADFSAIQLTVQVKGNASNVIDFVIDLNDHFNNDIIGSIKVTVPENSGGNGTTVDVRMTIYNYQEGI